MIRKCKSVEAMSRPDAWAGISVVARSGFESCADLLNCLKYGDDYARYMMWISFNQQLTHFRTIGSNPKSRFFRSLDELLKAKYQDVAGVIAEIKGHMAEFADELPDRFKDRSGNVRAREIFRFELAGLDDEYNALYRIVRGRTRQTIGYHQWNRF